MRRYQLEGFIGDEITAQGVSDLLAGAGGDDIIVDLYTTGGQIYEGIEVYNRIANYRGKKTAVLGGLVASIGTYISTAFDVVQAQSSTVFMLHNAASMVIGDSEDLRKESEELDRLNRHLAERLASRSGKTVNAILKMMDQTTYLYGQGIVDEGFADELIEIEAVAPLNKEEAQQRIAEAKIQHERRVAALRSTPVKTHEPRFFDEASGDIVSWPEFQRRQKAEKNLSHWDWADSSGRKHVFGGNLRMVTY